ncbi:N-acetylmuramoyl-L-alanine amidase [Rhinophrynus dorsalis]
MTAFQLIFVFALWVSAATDDAPMKMKMDTFLSLVQDLESNFPESSALSLTQLLLSVARPPFNDSNLSKGQATLVSILLSHKIMESEDKEWHEQGVVLAPDGSTVALKPLLEAVALGWKAGADCEQLESKDKNLGSKVKEVESGGDGFKIEAAQSKNVCAQSSNNQQGSVQASSNDDGQPISLAISLGLAFLAPGVPLDSPLIAVDGCWDSVSTPSSFKLQTVPDRPGLTLAFLNGALDGTLLGEKVRKDTEPKKLSALIQDYYWGKQARSPYRRQDFQALVEGDNLESQVQRGLYCYRHSRAGCSLPNITDDQLDFVAGASAKEFEQRYLECPAIIPRCMWGAKPYKGNPTYLNLPLSRVFIHHTYGPSQPCTTFHDCARDMRSMQDFHQITRGWDDIGYSFVAGSNGYLYEGRGWHWIGAHTRGHNSVGYGVSFIGDYTSTLPDRPILNLVKDRFLRCAFRSGYITANYTIQGHRQLVSTSCPGDSLYTEIQTWEHFKKH